MESMANTSRVYLQTFCSSINSSLSCICASWNVIGITIMGFSSNIIDDSWLGSEPLWPPTSSVFSSCLGSEPLWPPTSSVFSSCLGSEPLWPPTSSVFSSCLGSELPWPPTSPVFSSCLGSEPPWPPSPPVFSSCLGLRLLYTFRPLFGRKCLSGGRSVGFSVFLYLCFRSSIVKCQLDCFQYEV